MYIGFSASSELPTASSKSRPRWVIISCNCASTSSNPVKILFSPGTESSDPARLMGRPFSFKFGNCGLANGDMGTATVCSDSGCPFGGGKGTAEAVMEFSRSGDRAVLAGLLGSKAVFDHGSCFPAAKRLEEPSSAYIKGMLLVLADAVRLLRNGREAE